MKKFTKQQNLQFWEKDAKIKKHRKTGTHSDKYLVYLENRFILEELKKIRPKYLLDIGCGNGQRTLMFSSKVKETKGIDYSESMIRQAKNSLSKKSTKIKKSVTFEVGDISKYEDGKKYDVIISCRCIINQTNTTNQLKVFEKLYRMLKPNGSILIAEGSHEGYHYLNKIRKKVGIDPINVSWYNTPIREKIVFPKIKSKFKIERINKLGTYYHISRVLYPLSIFPKRPNPNSKVNNYAMKYEIDSQKENISHDYSEKFGAHLLVHLKKIEKNS